MANCNTRQDDHEGLDARRTVMNDETSKHSVDNGPEHGHVAEEEEKEKEEDDDDDDIHIALQQKALTAFQPQDLSQIHQPVALPDELWLAVLACPCTFHPDIFDTVMLNLIKNPNITSSHLFRADIFYDSEKDANFQPENAHDPYQGGLANHLKAEYRPKLASWPGFRLERTIVRQLIPRNPQLDKPLVQTCHFFQSQNKEAKDGEENNLVLYIPHIQTPAEMPFYHPAVSQIAFSHIWKPQMDTSSPPSPETSPQPGTLTILYLPFPPSSPAGPTPNIPTKLSRTALRLLQTIHKHGQGQLRGYTKRVAHDLLVPQKRYQDTYTRLKTKYGRRLSEQWIEPTDPGKHVFEDIGIAAWLIEMWREMYAFPGADGEGEEKADSKQKPPFPGFVDIGCGNGLLVYLLLSEGYSPGWGFDARPRRTWDIFPAAVRERLQKRILVPAVFQDARLGPAAGDAIDAENSGGGSLWHDGLFNPGTFIISNHADELTAWTPLLAHLNGSAFIAIPCCSHDLSGARFRAPVGTTTAARRKGAKGDASSASTSTTTTTTTTTATRLPQQTQPQQPNPDGLLPSGKPHAAETGSLKQPPTGNNPKKPPSAYASLCSYVQTLTAELGFRAEREILRIPSTRNTCIVGRQRESPAATATATAATTADGPAPEPVAAPAAAVHKVTQILERELGRPIAQASADWILRAEKVARKPGSGH